MHVTGDELARFSSLCQDMLCIAGTDGQAWPTDWRRPCKNDRGRERGRPRQHLYAGDTPECRSCRRNGRRVAASRASGELHGGGCHVEDNHSNLHLKLLSRRPGIQLEHAANGEAGLTLIRRRRPDLITEVLALFDRVLTSASAAETQLEEIVP